jgi:hypothetical protein
MSEGRYLTEPAKASELAQWRQLISRPWPPGPGNPDPSMIPWCEKINALPGICTLQSCQGHENGERGTAGHLWLWLDEEKARAFPTRASELAKSENVEAVSLLFKPWDQQVVEVIFRGSPGGKLGASMQEILDFGSGSF